MHLETKLTEEQFAASMRGVQEINKRLAKRLTPMSHADFEVYSLMIIGNLIAISVVVTQETDLIEKVINECLDPTKTPTPDQVAAFWNRIIPKPATPPEGGA